MAPVSSLGAGLVPTQPLKPRNERPPKHRSSLDPGLLPLATDRGAVAEKTTKAASLLGPDMVEQARRASPAPSRCSSDSLSKRKTSTPMPMTTSNGLAAPPESSLPTSLQRQCCIFTGDDLPTEVTDPARGLQIWRDWKGRKTEPTVIGDHPGFAPISGPMQPRQDDWWSQERQIREWQDGQRVTAAHQRQTDADLESKNQRRTPYGMAAERQRPGEVFAPWAARS